MVDDKQRDETQAGEQPEQVPDQPETVEFYSEISQGDDALARSVDTEAEEVGHVDPSANSRAFEEEMDDL